jgi:putative transposase
MAHTYTSLHHHVVFSTKGREPWLSSLVRQRLWPYLGGIARENKMTALGIGGVADHVHMLLTIPSSTALAKCIQLVKGGSSHWLKSEVPNVTAFAWQDGYGAFSVSASQLENVRAYIRNQEEHHRTTTFVDEYRALLRKHGVEFDERYWLG